MKRLFLLVAVTWLSLVSLAYPQARTYVLSLQGDGSATVVIDRKEGGGVAYIHDGGRGGTKGIGGARIDGQPVLDFLRSQGITTLVISCSHPHDDHMQGLVELINTGDFKGFTTLRFVDSVKEGATNSSGEKIEPLHEIYRKKWGSSPPPDVDYKEATNADAFGALGLDPTHVKVSNFRYDPESVGEDVHDSSVVAEFELRDTQGHTRNMVDFDDASSRLIKLWASQSPPRHATVLLMAHHGSRYNDMSPVLNRAKDFGLTDVVFTVNEGNRYLHPTPEMLLLAINSVGADHVHITGSEQGDAIEVAATGSVVRSGGEATLSRLASFVNDRIDAANEGIRNTTSARTRLRYAKDRDALEQILNTLEVKYPVNSRMASNGVAAFYARLGGLHQDQRASKESRDDRRSEVPIVKTSSNPPSGDGSPGTNPPRGDDGGGLGATIVSPTSPGGGSGGAGSSAVLSSGAGGGVSGASNAGGGSGGGGGPGGGGRGPSAGGGSGGASRYVNYTSIRADVVSIRFGGVIVGALPSGDALTALKFVEGKAQKDLSIRVTTAKGDVGLWGPFTRSQLWVAYNYVSPTEDLKRRYSGLPIEPNAGGLAGMVSPGLFGNTWSFALNPAVADTPLARDAMRLDMALAAAKANMHTESSAKLPWNQIGKPNTYEWLDVPATIEVKDNRVTIQPTEGTGRCIMRLRLLTLPSTGSQESAAQEKADMELVPDSDPELIKRVNAALANVPERDRTAYSDRWRERERAEIAESRRVDKVTAALSDQDNLSEDEKIRLRQITSQLHDAHPVAYEESWVSPEITDALCDGLPFLQRIDQVAKLIALFHRYQDTTERPLPPLTPSLMTTFEPVEAVWSMENVFSTPSTKR